MGGFFAELKRRHMYRVAAAYAVVAWVLLQLVNNLAPGLNLPNWAITLVIVLLAIGFPIAMLFAWIQHMAPAGGATAQAQTTKLDYVLAAALIAVLAGVAYDQLAPSRGARSAPQGMSLPAAPNLPGGVSVAVLPFANLSGDASQEFFSDGMTDEIITALTKISALRVVGRESVFQFKTQKPDMRAMSQALGAAYLIEGSVRKAGDRVRIAAQLTRADTGVNLWAETYDRELKDIFAAQSDIAQAIAGALKVPLGLQQGETLVRNRTDNLESYNDYLRARALVRARGTSIAQAIGILEKAVASDPSFAPTWALLARAYALAPTYGLVLRDAPLAEARASVKPSLGKAEMAANEAIRLDPQSAEGYGALAFVRFLRGQWVSAEELHLQALKLDANEPDILLSLSISLADAGRLTEALALIRNLRALEPFVPIYNVVTAEMLQARGQIGDSIPMLEAMAPDVAGGMIRNVMLAHAYAAGRDYDEAAATLLAMPQQQVQVSRRSVEDAAALLRNASAKTAPPQPLPELEGELKFAYFYAGAPERFLEYAERMIDVQYVVQAQFAYLWGPELGQVRKTERFKTLVRKAGLVDYWRAKGWPEFCHPTTGDDFECS